MRSPPALRLVRVDLTKRRVLRLALPRLEILSEVLGVGVAVDHFDLGVGGEHALDDSVLDEDFDFVFHRGNTLEGLYKKSRKIALATLQFKSRILGFVEDAVDTVDNVAWRNVRLHILQLNKILFDASLGVHCVVDLIVDIHRAIILAQIYKKSRKKATISDRLFLILLV
jgi:hypothetical protein